MTLTPEYDKIQVYYSINPDEDVSLTNYFIFPDFENKDPLCAITKRESVACTDVAACTWCNPPVVAVSGDCAGNTLYSGTGGTNVAVTTNPVSPTNPSWAVGDGLD